MNFRFYVVLPDFVGNNMLGQTKREQEIGRKKGPNLTETETKEKISPSGPVPPQQPNLESLPPVRSTSPIVPFLSSPGWASLTHNPMKLQ